MAEIVVTDEAVEAAASTLHPSMWREHTYVDPEPMRDMHRAETRAALEAAAPLLQVQVDREALRTEMAVHRIEAFNGSQVVCQCDLTWRSNTEYRDHLADAVLALLSPEETK